MYNVISESSLTLFIKEVKNAIDQGWKPVGGIAISEACFYQAMVKQ